MEVYQKVQEQNAKELDEFYIFSSGFNNLTSTTEKLSKKLI